MRAELPRSLENVAISIPTFELPRPPETVAAIAPVANIGFRFSESLVVPLGACECASRQTGPGHGLALSAPTPSLSVTVTDSERNLQDLFND